MPESRIEKVEWRMDRMVDDHKKLEQDHIKTTENIRRELVGMNDRLDRIIMVLLAGTFSVIVFFFGVAFALITGKF